MLYWSNPSANMWKPSKQWSQNLKNWKHTFSDIFFKCLGTLFDRVISYISIETITWNPALFVFQNLVRNAGFLLRTTDSVNLKVRSLGNLLLPVFCSDQSLEPTEDSHTCSQLGPSRSWSDILLGCEPSIFSVCQEVARSFQSLTFSSKCSSYRIQAQTQWIVQVCGWRLWKIVSN